MEGTYELVASPLLLAELERALGYPELRSRIAPADGAGLIALLRDQARLMKDPAETPAIHSPDPDDDYLIALAAASGAVLVSGDDHLQDLGQLLAVYSPATFLTGFVLPSRLEESAGAGRSA